MENSDGSSSFWQIPVQTPEILVQNQTFLTCHLRSTWRHVSVISHWEALNATMQKHCWDADYSDVRFYGEAVKSDWPLQAFSGSKGFFLVHQETTLTDAMHAGPHPFSHHILYERPLNAWFWLVHRLSRLQMVPCYIDMRSPRCIALDEPSSCNKRAKRIINKSATCVSVCGKKLQRTCRSQTEKAVQRENLSRNWLRTILKMKNWVYTVFTFIIANRKYFQQFVSFL